VTRISAVRPPPSLSVCSPGAQFPPPRPGRAAIRPGLPAGSALAPRSEPGSSDGLEHAASAHARSNAPVADRIVIYDVVAVGSDVETPNRERELLARRRLHE
jgi:hypothetical protein